MAYLVIDSEDPVPRAVTFLPPYPLSGFNPPIYSAPAPGPTAVESYPLEDLSGGNVDSPYALSLSYGNEVSNVNTMGGTLGVEVAPAVPTDAFATDEPYGQGFGAVQPTVQPWPVAAAG